MLDDGQEQKKRREEREGVKKTNGNGSHLVSQRSVCISYSLHTYFQGIPEITESP